MSSSRSLLEDKWNTLKQTVSNDALLFIEQNIMQHCDACNKIIFGHCEVLPTYKSYDYELLCSDCITICPRCKETTYKDMLGFTYEDYDNACYNCAIGDNCSAESSNKEAEDEDEK